MCGCMALENGAAVVCQEHMTRLASQIGTGWLRMKIRNHTAETFHRADSQLVYMALKDLFRVLDECLHESPDEAAIASGSDLAE